MRTWYRRIDFFLHPLPLTAVAIMAFNDHWGKYWWPGWVTGKLSDFCGTFYLPIFVLALWVLATRRRLTWQDVGMAILATDSLLIFVKMSGPGARAIEAWFAQNLFTISIVQDPTDLIALLVNPLTGWHLRRWISTESSK